MSWKNVELGDLCDVLDSQRKPITKRDRTVGEYPYYGATGIVDYVDSYIFDEKLVLIGEDGAKWESGESTAFIANGKYWVNNHAHVIRPKRDLLLDEWLVYYFYYKDLKEFVTGLTVPKLNQGQLKIIPIPLPPLSTQQKIVTKLDRIFAEIDKAMAAAEANAKNAEALFQSYLREIFTNDDLDWKTAELNSICDIFADGDWIESKDQSENGIRLIQTGNVGFGKFKARDSKARYISEETFKRLRCTEIKQNDILISRLPDPVGRACIIPKLDVKSITAVDCTIIRVKKEIVITEFFNFFCQSPQYFEQIRKNITGATRQRISRSLLGKTQIPIPPLVKQKDIVSKLLAISNELEKSSKSYTEKVNELTKLKQSILSQAFSGGLVKE